MMVASQAAFDTQAFNQLVGLTAPHHGNRQARSMSF